MAEDSIISRGKEHPQAQPPPPPQPQQQPQQQPQPQQPQQSQPNFNAGYQLYSNAAPYRTPYPQQFQPSAMYHNQTPNAYIYAPQPYPYQSWPAQPHQPASFPPAAALATPPGHHTTGSSTNATKTPRTKKLAILKDPNTNKEIPLPELAASEKPKTTLATTTKSATKIETTNTNNTSNSKGPTNSLSTTSSTSQSSSISSTTTSTSSSSTTNNNTNTSATPSLALLQKVSEEGVNVVSDTNGGDKKASIVSNAKSESSKAKITAPKPLETTSEVTEMKSGETNNSSKINDHTSNEQSTNLSPTSRTSNKTDSTTSSSPIETTKSSSSSPQNESTKDEIVKENNVTKPADGATADADKETAEDEAQSKEEEVELNYEPGQYNPSNNKEGRRVYSKEFMLAVAKRLGNIHLLDEEDKDNAARNSEPYQFHNMNDPFAPSFSNNNRLPNSRQNDPTRRPNQANYMGRSSTGQEKQRKIIPSSSLTQEVELKTVSNPWRPAKDLKQDVPADVLDSEQLKRKFRSILNKLTPNNFENLSKAVTDLNIDTEQKLGDVIDIVFEKALAEPKYCVLYGQMCSHLKKTSAGQANFGNTLLKRCQLQFQTDVYADLNIEEREKAIEDEKDPDVKKHKQEELYEEMRLCRQRSLGLIIFIGELYKIQMLNDKIMFECIIRLLSDTSNESLECLCDLLTTIGKKLDESSQEQARNEQKTQKAPKAPWTGRSAAVVAGTPEKRAEPQSITTLDPVFESIKKIRNRDDLNIELRIKFKLLDLLELREKHKWHSKDAKDNNPKKIDEIKQAHIAKLEEENRQNMMGPRRSQEGRRGLGHSGGSSNQISSLANNSSGIRGPSNMHGSSSSHSIRDHPASNDVESQKEYQRSLGAALGVLGQTGGKPTDLGRPPPVRLGPTSLRPQAAARSTPASANTPATSSGGKS